MSKKITFSSKLIKKLSEYYLNTASLSKTAKWLNNGCPNTDGIQTETPIFCTRHPLARIFKENGIFVKAPNGGGIDNTDSKKYSKRIKQNSKSDKKRIVDPTMYFIAQFYRELWLDINHPDLNNIHNFLSACHFIIYDDRHILFCDYINRDHKYLATKIPRELLICGAEEYLRFLKISPIYYKVWLKQDVNITNLLLKVGTILNEKTKKKIW